MLQKTINNIIKLADNYLRYTTDELLKVAVIRKLPNGKYQVQSRKGKNLGTYRSKSKAQNRLRQVEFFKHLDKSDADDCSQILDLTDIHDFSYSAVMRKIRQTSDEQTVREFLQIYKKQFDNAIRNKLQKPEKVALQNALLKFNKLHKIKLDKAMVKNAAVTSLGDPHLVGKYLADIIRFTLNRISPERRPHSIDSLRHKIYSLNENEIGTKNLPPSSAIGQSITFVKHVLFNHDPRYVREVLNHIVRNL